MPIDNVQSQLAPNAGLLAALKPNVMSDFASPQNIPVSPTALAQMQTQRDIAKGQLKASLLGTILPLQVQQQQNAVANAQKQQQINNETGFNQANIAKVQADTAQAQTGQQQAALNLQKDQLLQHAASVGGSDAYMAVLSSIDPGKYADVRKAQEEVNSSVIGQKKSIQDLDINARKDALDQYDKLNGVAQSILLAPEAKRAQIYEQTLPFVRQVAPDVNLPDSYTPQADNALHGFLLAHTSILEDLNKNGAVGVGTQLAAPDATQGAATQLNQLQGQAPGTPIPGQPLTPDQKSVKADILNRIPGDIPVPGQTNLSARVVGKVTQANTGIEAAQTINNILQGTRLNPTVKLPELLNGPQGQQLQFQLNRLQNAVANARGVDPKEVGSEMPNAQDLGPTIQLKTNALVKELNGFQTNAGVNPNTPERQLTGLIHPTTKAPITMADILDTAKTNKITPEQALALVKQHLGVQGQ